jgi:hypothetical protein
MRPDSRNRETGPITDANIKLFTRYTNMITVNCHFVKHKTVDARKRNLKSFLSQGLEVNS